VRSAESGKSLLVKNDDSEAARPSAAADRPDQGVSRRDIILREAAALFAAHGVAATTVRQIAEAAGVLSGSLYHHFPSKEVMVQDIVLAYLEDLRGRYQALLELEAEPVDRLRQLALISVQTATDHPYAVEIYQNEGAVLRTVPRNEHVSELAQEVHQYWAVVIRAGVDALELRSDVSARLFHRLIRDAVWLSPRWYRPTDGYPPDRFADDLLAVFLDGFSAR
jgi:TetR/AcrR family transcriptional regulator, cholesterol catabolism regulator